MAKSVVALTSEDRRRVMRAVAAANEAAEGDSNDAEIECLQDALDEALGVLGLDRYEDPEAD